MKFILDENFPLAARTLLEQLGHEVIAPPAFHKGMDDHQLFDIAQQSNAILLTTDRDFFHTIPFLFKKHTGVIVVALKRPNRESILNRLNLFLEGYDLTQMEDSVVELRDNSFALRRPLPE